MPDKTTGAGELPVVAVAINDITGLMKFEVNDPDGIRLWRAGNGSKPQPLVLASDATAALAQKDGEIAALKALLADLVKDFYTDVQCDSYDRARAALGSQA